MASFRKASLVLAILCFTSAATADLSADVINDASLRHLLQASCPATGSTCYTEDGTTGYCCPGGYNCYSSAGLTCYLQGVSYPSSSSGAVTNGFVVGSPPAKAPAPQPGSAVGVPLTGSSCTSSAYPTTCTTADGSAQYCCPSGSGCFSSSDFTCYIREATGVYPSAPSNFDCSKIIEITVDEIQAYFSTGELTSRALIKCYLQRIADFDNPVTFKGEVAYATNSIIELNPTVLADADAKDAERATCAPNCNLSKIHGIPVLLKDNVAADGMNVTAGSYALLGGYHSPAFLTVQILNAGGIILGKAGLSEWANFRSDYSVSGWSGRGGQVYDPYVRYFTDGTDNVTDPYTNIPSAVTPGVYHNASNPGIVSGSSSGSAVAAAANMVTLTIGSETSGSILSPSQYNAVAGIKPTVGLVSRSGVVPLSASQDTAGPICRTLTDATYLLDIIAAPDATDPVTLTQVVPAGGYKQFLNKNGLQGKKIAIGPVGPYDGADDKIMAAYAQAAEFMRSAGATVDVLPDNFTLPGNDLDTGLLLWYDFKQNIATYLSEVTWAPGVTPKYNLEDLIQFNLDNYLLEFQGGTCCRGQVAYGNFFQDIFDVAQNTSGFDDPTYIQYKANAAQTKVLIEQFFQSNGYDAITSLGDYIDNFARTQQPGVTVPLALSAAGYPLGIIFHGLSYTEGKLIEIAYAFEQGFGFGRPAPTYCDSASCS